MKHAILWKRILNGGLQPVAHSKVDAGKYVQKIITSPIIVAPAIRDSDGGSSWYDLKSLSIPFPRFWIEGTVEGKPRDLWGCLFESTPTDEGFHIRAACCYGWTDVPPKIMAEAEFDLDKSGTPIKDRFQLDVPSEIVKLVGDAEAVKGGIVVSALAGCLSLMILGCKNVSLQQHENDPKQVRRAIKRHGGTPENYRYHTLVVRQPGAHKDSPAQEIGVMPHHVCRGHFAEYGPEFNKGLLFGKYAGRFYVPPCVKGSKKHGTVEKDYLIATESP